MEQVAVKTGVFELDVLLGGGIKPGSIVLVRGDPGSGKTTLAIQLLAKHLQRSNHTWAVFLSLEDDPGKALERAQNAFNFGSPLANKRLFLRDRSHILDLLQTDDRRYRALNDLPLHKTAKSNGHLFDPDPNETANALVVIDSLNLLVSCLSTKAAEVVVPALADDVSQLKVPGSSRNWDAMALRLLLYTINETLKQHIGNAVVVIIGEFHTSLPASIIAESFLCDVEIRLGREPVRDTAQVSGGHTRGVINHLADSLLFCRVLKSRSGPNQWRRCAYEIVSGRGLVFYDLYPGDGKIFLFAENEPQRRIWNEFCQHDIPHNYPALRYEQFDRSGLQRTFTAQHGFRNLPHRTDLYLACFDTYWVNWFVELCQKWEIADIVQQGLAAPRPYNAKQRVQFANLICRIQRELTEMIAGKRKFTVKQLAMRLDHTIRKDVWPIDLKDHLETLKKTWEYFQSERGQGGLLALLPEPALRLFGQLRSPLVRTFQTDRYHPAGCIPHRSPVGRKYNGRSVPLLRSIPYNANVSFLVCNADLLASTLDQIAVEKLSRAVEDVYDAECEYLGLLPKNCKRTIANCVDHLIAGRQPRTWEEVIALCRLTKANFVIDTRTFDTFLCTALEMVWGVGADLVVHADYAIDNRTTTTKGIMRVCYLLATMFSEGIIPADCSIEPEFMKERFSEGSTHQWLFARHWYSTLVDLLTRRDPNGTDFTWNPGKIGLDIHPLPSAISPLNSSGAAPGSLVSCWGDWHLGMIAGTENVALGLNLVNNLMSSQKVCERAHACAALPTVERFYKLYGKGQCFRFPERTEIRVPKTSFNEVYAKFFTIARYRSRIFDYRHCMRKVHALLEHIRSFPEAALCDLKALVDQTLDDIVALKDIDLLQLTRPEVIAVTSSVS